MKTVPATQALAKQYYGEQPIPTMRAYMLLDDEEKIIAVAGFIRLHSNTMVIFSESKPEDTQKHRKSVYEFAKTIMKIADDHHWNLLASRDHTLETSGRFLKRLGFEETEDGEYVRWAH